MDAPSPSLLACIAKKLPIVAISRDFLAFEDDFEGLDGKTRCWVTLLPLSAGGAWVDYVYALVSLDKAPAKVAAKKAKAPEPEPEAEEIEAPVAEELEEPAEEIVEEEEVAEAEEPEIVADDEEQPGEAAEEFEEDEADEPAAAAVAKAAPGFSKLLDSLAGLTGFYGSQPVKVEPVIEPTVQAEDVA